jgi:hypothetical protein
VAGAPARIVVAAGDGQTATVVTNVAVAPAVKVVDRFGNGLPRIEVQFASGGETGVVFRRFERTDAEGVARVGAWMLGVRPGVYTMRVTALTLAAVVLHATAVAGAPARLRVAAGDAQVAPAGSTLPIAPAVQVTDVWGNPLPAAGLSVTFTVRGESGTVTGAEQVTDANGVARAGSWTIGALTIGGGNLLTAQSPGLTSATFLATGR